MFPTPRTKHSQLKLSLQIIFVLLTCIVATQGQGRNRDQARAIQRAEMNRLLLFSTTTDKESDSRRLAVLKEIKDDFRDLQALNNKMMADAWAHETLDYSLISDMVSRIRGKAVRLKTNLSLPAAADLEKAPVSDAANARELRAALLVLDRTIMSFVNNPLFKEPKTIEMNQAIRARQDLESVIDLTGELKKLASRLATVSKSK
jgi:hypothetical protein